MTNPQGQQGDFDPFEQGEGVKSISFKDAPVNSVITLVVDDDAKWLQSRDFETGELKYWDARPGETPNPVMAAVVTGEVQDTPWARQLGIIGERRSVWATKPSSMFTAIQTAKRNAGGGTPVPILRGGRLDIAYTGEIPNEKNPRLNPIKQYAARYTPPPPGYGVADPFAGGEQQQAAPGQAFTQAAAPAVAQVGTFAGPPQQQPQGNPFGQQPAAQPFGQQAPAAQQPQPAMAAAAPADPWASAPSADVPPF